MTETEVDRYARIGRELVMLPWPESARDWPQDFEHENGNYCCRCCVCGQEFTGHKRRVQCRECYGKRHVAEEQRLLAAGSSGRLPESNW